MVTFRAIVMLTVLVGLPAAWIYFDPLPESTQKAIGRVARTLVQSTGWLDEAEGQAEDKSPPVFDPLSGVASASYESASSPSPAITQAASPAEPLAARLEPHLSLLRQLGVSEYTLREWGATGTLYRFSCSVTAGAITREFDAVSDDPFTAVSEVVGEVTSCQNARSTHVVRR